MNGGFLPGDGLLNFVSPNFIILFSPIFSGGRPKNVLEFGGGGVWRDNFLLPAGLAGTGGGAMAGGGPGVTVPKEEGLILGAGGRMLGGGGRLGGRPLVAIAGGWR